MGADVRVDGAQRQFSEPLLKDVLQKCWTSGGDPNMIMLGGFDKQQMSTFVGRGQPMEETKSKKIVNAVNTYEGDFGLQKVVPNRFQRARDVWVVANRHVGGVVLARPPHGVRRPGDDRRQRCLLHHLRVQPRGAQRKVDRLLADCTTS